MSAAPVQQLPIGSLAELLSWRPSQVTSNLPYSLFNQFEIRKGNKQKTLVCHDFKGGYHEDSFIDGCTTLDDPYVFLHWNYVDIFVYFSHHFVTIPPPGWIAAGHIHDCLVLGTLITEWDKGAVICQAFLKDISTCREVVNQLVSIAKSYGFDGWLINIENAIKKEIVGNLAGFVSMLRDSCKETIGQHAKVIWYDSITTDGTLEWQNELNDKNQIFFDCSDGIFLNYNWRKKNLRGSQLTAGDRAGDVFVGIDVWGRNCCGGFNSWLAMDQISMLGMSSAIFAPGWVYESLGCGDFALNNQRFWRLLSDYLPCRKILTVPFKTDFCTGIKSEVDSSCRIFNLNTQKAQPHYLCSSQDDVDFNSVSVRITSALCQSLCLKLTDKPVRLFCLNVPLQSLTACSVRYKIESDPADGIEVLLTFGLKRPYDYKEFRAEIPHDVNSVEIPATVSLDFASSEYQDSSLQTVSISVFSQKTTKQPEFIKVILYEFELK